jgi:hypothetical protein
MITVVVKNPNSWEGVGGIVVSIAAFQIAGRIQNGKWDIDTDCMSSENQGPC